MPHAIKMDLIENEKSVQVMLKLDMSAYCIALREYVAARRQIELDRQSLDLVSTKAILSEENKLKLDSFEQAIRPIYENVQKEKNVLSALVSRLAGEMHGATLIELLKSRLAIGNCAERALAVQLEFPDKPLIFECLESDFVELLKNSMDAIIDKAIESGLRQDMHLMMHLHLEVLSNDLVIVSIRDNGAGFSSQYLEQFSSYIEEKKYLNSVYTTHKNNSSFYFGGRGRGIAGICGKLLDGVAIKSNRNVKVYHSDSCTKSNIWIKNVDGGAELVLICSATPPKKHQDFLFFCQNEALETLPVQAHPVRRGESLVVHETSSSSSSSSSSDYTSLREHSVFSHRELIKPLNPAVLMEAVYEFS